MALKDVFVLHFKNLLLFAYLCNSQGYIPGKISFSVIPIFDRFFFSVWNCDLAKAIYYVSTI